MIKVLFLDDDENRHKTFKTLIKLKNATYTFTYGVDDTIKALNKEKFNVAFLDHDLGSKQFSKNIEGTGMEVALHIEKMSKEKQPEMIIIHSFNPAGAIRMYNILKSCIDNVYLIPFNNIFSQIRN